MNDEERFLELCAEIRQMTGSHSPELAAKVSELAELNIEGAGAGVDVRLQDSIMPSLILHEADSVWSPLWSSMPDWEKCEALTEIGSCAVSIKAFWNTSWDDDEMMHDAASNLEIDLGDDDDEDEDEEEEEDSDDGEE